MTLETLKNKIKTDAQHQAQQIIDAAKAQAKELAAASKKEQALQEQALKREHTRTRALLEARELASARMQAKRAILEIREGIIDKVIEEAMKQATKTKAYESFLISALKKHKGLQGNLTITCNKRDKALVEKHSKGTINVQDVNGLIIEDTKGNRIDEQLFSKLERLRGDIRQAVAEKLL